VNQINQWFRQLAKKTTCPAQDLGFRIWDLGFGIWDLGTCNMGFNTSWGAKKLKVLCFIFDEK